MTADWLEMRPGWMYVAACRSYPPTLWVSSGDDGVMDRSTARYGARVCFSVCPVRDECLRYSMRSGPGGRPEPQGVWGGLTYPQRTRWYDAPSAKARAEIEDDARRLAQIVPRLR